MAVQTFIEGIPSTEPRINYGGTNAADNSGVMKYISIRHGGSVLAADNEINGLTLGGVGNGTEVDYIEIFATEDDGIEIFGGTVNVKHIALAFVGDDSFDVDESWSGFGQYIFSIAPNENAIEYDGTESATFSCATEPAGRIYNGTFIGNRANSISRGARIRNNGSAQIWNSIITDVADYAYRFDASSCGANAVAGNIAFNFTTLVNGVRPTTFQVQEVNPQLAGVSLTPNGRLDPRPNASSPALSGTDTPTITEAEPTTYRGAFSNEENWALGWTALDAYGYFGNLVNLVIPEDAQLIKNGSFESYNIPLNNIPSVSGVTNLLFNSTGINSWKVTLGDVDHVENGFWQASDGRYSIDLSGYANGEFSQILTTEIGKTYNIKFDLSGNFAVANATKKLKVTAANTSREYSFNTTGISAQNMKWQTQTFTFTATSISTTLSFTSLDNSFAGPVIDNVRAVETTTCGEVALDKGLVAYYPFNGNSNDASGNNNNGTVKGATLTTDRFGTANRAYDFDGLNDYIELNRGLNLAKTYTVSAWVKLRKVQNEYHTVIAKYETSRYGPYYFGTYSNKAEIWISDGQGGHKDHITEPIEIGKWEHLTWVGNETQASIYINGQKIGTYQVPLMTQNNDLVTIGRQALYLPQNNDYASLDGQIDDLRLYNRAFKDCEVEALYNSERENSDLCANFGFATIYSPTSLETCNNQLYSVNPTGGKTPYTYKWSNGSTEEFIGGVAPGNYSVTVTDANNCSIDTTIAVIANELPTIAVNSKTSANCTGGGAVQIAVTKGLAPYTYKWSSGQTTANLSNVAAGTYTLTVSDVNGCTDTETVLISLQVVTPSISNIQTQQATVNWTSLAGVSSYEVQYRKKGDTNWIAAGSNTGSSLVINNLQPQTDYEAQVIAKCSSTLSSTSVTVSFRTAAAAGCNAPGLPSVQNLQTTGATVSWAAVAGAIEYRVELKKEADANFRFYNATASNSMVLSNLEANTRYQVRVKTICNGLESQPSAVATFATQPSNTTPTIPTGGLQLWLRSDAGVVLANNFVSEWKDQSGNNRHAVQTITDARPTVLNNALNGRPVVRFQATGEGDGLVVPSMDLTNTQKVEIFVVYNNTNDPVSGGAVVLENSTNFNLNPTGFFVSDNDDSCFTCPNGVTTGHRGNVGWHVLNTLPLEAGYRMLNTMFDKSSAQEVALKINGVIPDNTTFTLSENNTNPFGNNATYIGRPGAGNVNSAFPMEGGIAEILIYNNLLSAGDRSKVENYLCQKYNLPCQTDVCADFRFGSPVTTNSVQTCGNEIYTVYPEGGLAPYSYKWSNGSQESFIAGVPSGSYSVTVTDANGCAIDSTIVVAPIEYPEVTISSNTSGTCSNGGSVQISVIKGVAPYTYKWSSGQTTANLTDVGAGTYTVTVSDSRGCTANGSETINLRTAIMESILSRNNQATFNWTSVAGATRYELQYRVRGTENWQSGSTVTSNTATVTNLVPNTDYEARIISTCASGRSSTSSPVRFSTLPSGASGLQQVNFKDGVATEADINQFALFPNPTSGNLTIQYQSSDVTTWVWTISDATGRVIQKVQSPQASGETMLDLSNLPSGLYWVSTVLNGQMVVEKVVKQ
ncbi:MAG: choice-of-anchor C family protein [Saprospiraceae bacterium]|nr:choice-of-anchor C family protein [Saprospiraceae bacterium]